MAPLVSVICISHNHAAFVRESLESVLHQTYSPVELLIVDDASADNSVMVINDWLRSHPEVRFFPLKENMGNCKSFNRAFEEVKGKYVIDLSADDVLLPRRIERGVSFLESHPEVGVQFSDAELIDGAGKRLGFHSDRFPHDTVPQGSVFREILSRYFINSPTMMIRKSLLDELGGYDESLAYEDFDFWVRSAPRTRYAYIPEALVRRRVLPASMGKQQYKVKSKQAHSTLAVCRKALAMCHSPEDFGALRTRLSFEFRQALRVANLPLAWACFSLWRKAR